MTTAAYRCAITHPHPSQKTTNDGEWRWTLAFDSALLRSTRRSVVRTPRTVGGCDGSPPQRSPMTSESPPPANDLDVMASASLCSNSPSPDEPSGHPESSSDAMAAPQSLPMTPPGTVLCLRLRQHQYDIGWIGGRRLLTSPLLPLRDDGRQTTRPSDAAEEENDGRQTTRPSDVRRCRRE